MTPSGDSYSWCQPLCDWCWPVWLGVDEAEAKAPVRVRGQIETCCHCGEQTESGIYIRIDPNGAFCARPSLRR